MTGCVHWSDIREQAVERAGGAEAFEEGERRILAEAQGFGWQSRVDLAA